jgi:hypothetical protein
MTHKDLVKDLVELFGEYKPAMLQEVINYIMEIPINQMPQLKKEIVLKYEDKFRIPPCVAAIKNIWDGREKSQQAPIFKREETI